ncbi:chromosome partitioning protein [Pseudoscardovia radai]|uniref:Chromosome partitioning protein n=1 Tax=Pseudoscardovia radai TaxID=987066 RepID=A0A261EUK2_9BIFI|nr:ParA family protein [Pseudoscardovia radai]OZG50552.1 chromosome partitioning protein [Pseudoscardovia radai]
MAAVSRETPSSGDHIETTSEILGRIFAGSTSGVGGELAQNQASQEKLDQTEFPHPSRTRYIAVANQKGGVGKTTTAVNLSAAWAEAGMSVLFIDMDPQGNGSTAFGAAHNPDVVSVYDVIEGRAKFQDAMQGCEDFSTIDIVPSNINLSGAELEIADMDNRVFLLRDALREYLDHTDKHYDYVVIDCPPSLGLLVLNALSAVQEVLIPIQAEYYALEGLGQLIKTISLVQQSTNPTLIVSTMLVTMVDRRTLLSKEVYSQIKQHYPDIVLDTDIPRSVRVSEAPSYGQSVIAYDPRSIGAVAYRKAAYEIACRSEETLKRIPR